VSLGLRNEIALQRGRQVSTCHRFTRPDNGDRHPDLDRPLCSSAVEASRGECCASLIAVIHPLRAAAPDGGLMSYGVDGPKLFRQAAVYADRILKGTDPAQNPIFLLTKFDLVINLTTARH